MVLGVGIVSAFIISKNRKGYMTRLQKLSKQLRQNPINEKTLNSYPIKFLFQIFLIVSFIGLLYIWLIEYQSQHNQRVSQTLKENFKQFPLNFQTVVNEDLMLKQVYHKNWIFGQDSKAQYQPIQSQISFVALSTIVEMQKQYQKVKQMIYFIMIFFLIPLSALFGQLKFEKITICRKKILIVNSQSSRLNINSTKQESRQESQCTGQVHIKRFSFLSGWLTQKIIKIYYPSDNIKIALEGSDTFTHKNTVYSIKKFADPAFSISTQRQQKSASLQEVIINRGNIYQARKTLIYLCHILFPITNKKVEEDKKNQALTQKDKKIFFPQKCDLNIINGPIKVKKTKTMK